IKNINIDHDISINYKSFLNINNEVLLHFIDINSQFTKIDSLFPEDILIDLFIKYSDESSNGKLILSQNIIKLLSKQYLSIINQKYLSEFGFYEIEHEQPF